MASTFVRFVGLEKRPPVACPATVREREREKERGSRRVKERINRPLVSLGHCPLFRCLLKQLTGASRCVRSSR